MVVAIAPLVIYLLHFHFLCRLLLLDDDLDYDQIDVVDHPYHAILPHHHHNYYHHHSNYCCCSRSIPVYRHHLCPYCFLPSLHPVLQCQPLLAICDEFEEEFHLTKLSHHLVMIGPSDGLALLLMLVLPTIDVSRNSHCCDFVPDVDDLVMFRVLPYLDVIH